MENLPNEIIEKIMFKLPFRSFQNMGETCKIFHEIYEMSIKRYHKLYPYIFDSKLSLTFQQSILKGRTLLSQKSEDEWVFMYIEHEKIYSPNRLTFYIHRGEDTIYYPDKTLQKYIESQELEEFVKSPVTFLSDEDFLNLKEFLISKNIKITI